MNPEIHLDLAKLSPEQLMDYENACSIRVDEDIAELMRVKEYRAQAEVPMATVTDINIARLVRDGIARPIRKHHKPVS